MSAVFSVAAAAVAATLICLVLRRTNAEAALLLSLALCAAAAALAAGMLKSVVGLMRELGAISGLAEVYFMPVLKCVGIGLLSRLASDLCRDGGQSAMAGAVETVGSVCAMYVSLPLIETFMEMLFELL